MVGILLSQSFFSDNLSNKFYVSAKNKNSIVIQNNLENNLVFFGVSNLFNNILKFKFLLSILNKVIKKFLRGIKA